MPDIHSILDGTEVFIKIAKKQKTKQICRKLHGVTISTTIQQNFWFVQHPIRALIYLKSLC